MPRFFVEPFSGEEPVVTGEDARHIARSLRMREGESLTLCDGEGMDYRCVILGLEPEAVRLQVLERVPSAGEPPARIRLYQALPKGDKLDFIVQKAVELGVREIVPVLTKRCVSRPDEKSMAKKIDRLQKIALEAAKQSDRGIVPQVLPLERYRKAIDGMMDFPAAILCYEEAEEPLSRLLPDSPRDIAVMVGSEGGFSPDEATLARERGVPTVSLGPRILRCETAPVCVLSAILYAYGEF